MSVHMTEKKSCLKLSKEFFPPGMVTFSTLARSQSRLKPSFHKDQTNQKQLAVKQIFAIRVRS